MPAKKMRGYIPYQTDAMLFVESYVESRRFPDETPRMYEVKVIDSHKIVDNWSCLLTCSLDDGMLYRVEHDASGLTRLTVYMRVEIVDVDSRQLDKVTAAQIKAPTMKMGTSRG